MPKPWSLRIQKGWIIGVFEDGYAIEAREAHVLVPLDCVFSDKKTAVEAVVEHIREKKRGIAAQRVLLDEREALCDKRLEELQPRDKTSWEKSVEAFEKIAAFHGRKTTSGYSWPYPKGTWGMSMCADGWKIWEATESVGNPIKIISGLFLENLVSIANSKEVLRWESRDYAKKPKRGER